MFRAVFFRSSWVVLLLLLAGTLAANKHKRPPAPPPPPPPPPYPTTAIHQWGYQRDSSDLLCCQSRLIGWTKNGDVAILSSSYSPEEQQFRYAIDLHDPEFLDPEELFATTFFVADDSLPLGCEESKDPLRCIWKNNQKTIGETLRKYGVTSTDVHMRPTPHVKLRFVPDPLPDLATQISSGLSLYDTAGRIVLEMPDTNGLGLHLVPIGTIVRNRPTPVRYMVMRCFSRDALAGPTNEQGVRLLRLSAR